MDMNSCRRAAEDANTASKVGPRAANRRSAVLVLGCLVLLLCLAGQRPAAAQDMVLEVIPLKHRPVSEVLPIIRPFVDKRGTVTGMNNQLIVRTTPANLEELRRILERIDAAARRLVVTVRFDAADRGGTGRAEVAGEVGVGGDGKLTAGRPAPGTGDRVQITVRQTAARSEFADTQQIRVLEGNVAFIAVGQSIPIPERATTATGETTTTHDTIRYKDVTSGFYVLPRLSGDRGDRVTLEISPHKAALSRHGGGAIDVQQMHTTVATRLDEWIEIGAVTRNEQTGARGIVFSTADRSDRHGRIFLRVTEEP